MHWIGWVVAGLVGFGVLAVTIRFLLVRKLRGLEVALAAELEARGESVIIAPEPGSYRGGTGDFSAIKSDGVVALTKSALWIRPMFAEALELSVKELKSHATAAMFRGAGRVGIRHLVVTTKAGEQLGLYVGDLDRWSKMLRTLKVKRDKSGDES